MQTEKWLANKVVVNKQQKKAVVIDMETLSNCQSHRIYKVVHSFSTSEQLCKQTSGPVLKKLFSTVHKT